jgi:hypothetical protein
MKKIILLLGLWVPWTAFANIGDTPRQSAARYGRALGHTGNLWFYHVKGWFIQQ